VTPLPETNVANKGLAFLCVGAGALFVLAIIEIVSVLFLLPIDPDLGIAGALVFLTMLALVASLFIALGALPVLTFIEPIAVRHERRLCGVVGASGALAALVSLLIFLTTPTLSGSAWGTFVLRVLVFPCFDGLWASFLFIVFAIRWRILQLDSPANCSFCGYPVGTSDNCTECGKPVRVH
jgi:nitrate/nitrite transporter NarK